MLVSVLFVMLRLELMVWWLRYKHTFHIQYHFHHTHITSITLSMLCLAISVCVRVYATVIVHELCVLSSSMFLRRGCLSLPFIVAIEVLLSLAVIQKQFFSLTWLRSHHSPQVLKDPTWSVRRSTPPLPTHVICPYFLQVSLQP